MPESRFYSASMPRITKFCRSNLDDECILEMEYTLNASLTNISVKYYKTKVVIIDNEIVTISPRIFNGELRLDRSGFMKHLDEYNAMQNYSFGPFRCTGLISEAHLLVMNDIVDAMI